MMRGFGLLIVAAIMFTGCGGSSPRSGRVGTTSTTAHVSAAARRTSAPRSLASSAHHADSSAHANGTPPATGIQHAVTAFRGCVVAHGANPKKLADPAGRTAVKACRSFVTAALSAAATSRQSTTAKPGASPSPRSDFTRAFTAGLHAFAACMRTDGIDMPDPTTTGGPIFNTKGLDTTGAKFKAAEVKCNPILRRVVNSAAK